jgi:RimJ/RimL family protein N-acetyltransferase
MAVTSLVRPAQSAPVRLCAFDAELHADSVSSWIRSDYEAFFLAPRTRPPITPERIREWSGPGRMQAVLVESGSFAPVAYGELNVMENAAAEFWLGHLIVDPARRGDGYGTRLTRMLLHHAFVRLAAKRVSLVVFYENYAAISAYKAAGMYADGTEQHEFPHYNRSVRLLRMAAQRLDG